MTEAQPPGTQPPGIQPPGIQRPLGPRSAALLAYLLRVPRLGLIVGVIFVFFLGAFLPGPFGTPFILVIAALVAWLAWLGWPAERPGTRAARVVVVLVLLVFAISKCL